MAPKTHRHRTWELCHLLSLWCIVTYSSSHSYTITKWTRWPFPIEVSPLGGFGFKPTGKHTVDGSEIWQTHQLEVGRWNLIIYKVLAPSKRWWASRISGCHQQYVWFLMTKKEWVASYPSFWGLINSAGTVVLPSTRLGSITFVMAKHKSQKI